LAYDVLIIGAGLSGLAAGIRLAQHDRRVAILERHYLWGGLNSFYKRAGRRFDTGLHALTNFAPRSAGGAPLVRVLRQLRIPYDALELGEQSFSETVFRTAGEILRLRYSNDPERMRAEVERLFPSAVDGYDRLLAALPGYAEIARDGTETSARERVAEIVREPLLVEMLLAPPFFYGNASEDDMPWRDFAVLFRAIHLEGLARPAHGIKRLLDLLVARFRESGGELRTRCGVARVLLRDRAAHGVVLDDGTEIEAERVLSSAGADETRALCGLEPVPKRAPRISIFESISILDRLPRDLGHAAAVTFFNEGPRLAYARPSGLVGASSGVTCAPNNYATQPPLAEGAFRVSLLANPDRWADLPEPEYAAAKARARDVALDLAARFHFDPRPHTVLEDSFTPRTIERFTGHFGGALYGSPAKLRDGAIGVENLSVIGTDQGGVGIVGALASGIAAAHRCEVVSG
jgi:phytoene dehydrogenase-like protein